MWTSQNTLMGHGFRTYVLLFENAADFIQTVIVLDVTDRRIQQN